MSSRRSPPGALPDRFQRTKRLSGHLSPNEAPPKRKRSTPGLKDYDDIHQHLLQAAAMVLCVPIEKLLSLAGSPTPSSKDNSSDSLEVSSNSSANDWVEELTPLESSNSERAMNETRSRFSRRQRPHPVSIESFKLAPTHVHASTNHVEDLLPERGFKSPETHTSIDLFASGEPYPTPTDSQITDLVMPDNLWQEPPVTDFLLPSYNAQTAGNHTTALLPSTGNLADPNNLSFSGYGAELPFPVNQNLQPFEEPDYSGFNWSSLPTAATTGSIDLFAPSPSIQSYPKSTTKDSGTKGRRRGPFRSEEQRQETGLTRRNGACIRCSMQRIRCVPDPSSPSGCCKTCIQAPYSRTRWLPCLRYKITDTELLAHDVCPRPTWTTRWKKMELVDISTWASDSIKTIECTQGIENTSYFLKVREFQPVEGDTLYRRWAIDGVEYRYECAPYAVPDMMEAGRTLIKFARQSLPAAIKFWIDKPDPLLRDTYNMAYNYSMSAESEEDRSLLNATLRMWAASRMMSRAAYICGTETLGMKRRDYGPRSTSTNKILLPPVFSAQMEVIFVAMVLQPTKKEVLDRLKKLMSENKRSSWFAIYLCIFLLLHSCALLTARDRERARNQGVQWRFYQPRVIDELHTGAKILLAHFHFFNKGSYPLHMDWTSPDQIALSELKSEQVIFMRKSVKEFEKRSTYFRSILESNAYEDEYYFIAQLYERDWKPRHTV